MLARRVTVKTQCSDNVKNIARCKIQIGKREIQVETLNGL